MRKWRWIGGAIGAVIVAIVILVLLPAPDPLAGVETVAVRVGDDAPSTAIDFESQLRIALGDRDITIVGDEASADMILRLTDLTVNLGDVEFSLTDGQFRGRASAECRLTDVRTGETHVMDFHIRVENGTVRAELVGRKFWEFWK